MFLVGRSYEPKLKPARHVSLCISTKQHFYYMPMRITHENNLRARILNYKHFNTFFIIYSTNTINFVVFRRVVLVYWHFKL